MFGFENTIYQNTEPIISPISWTHVLAREAFLFLWLKIVCLKLIDGVEVVTRPSTLMSAKTIMTSKSSPLLKLSPLTSTVSVCKGNRWGIWRIFFRFLIQLLDRNVCKDHRSFCALLKASLNLTASTAFLTALCFDVPQSFDGFPCHSKIKVFAVSHLVRWTPTTRISVGR